MEKLVDLYSNGELAQAFVLPTVFIVTVCKFYKARNNVFVITIQIDEKEDVSSNYIVNRKLTRLERISLIKQLKEIFSKSVPGNKMIYIYE